MGFGIGDIVNGAKNAVSSAVNTVSHAAESVGNGVQKAEQKVADVIKSAVDAVSGQSGFDDDNKHGPLAESKPKGSGGSSSSVA